MKPQDDDALLDLLERWEEARVAGTEIPVEELCRDRPELTEIVRAKVAALKASDWMGPDGHAGFGPRVLAGRYRLERLVGEGGYGQVWRGFDEELQRPVAVKVPKASRRLGEQQIDQLLTEARRVARLRHPGIVTVHDVLKEGAAYVIVSDFIDGDDLAERLRRGPLPVEDAVAILAQVARILDYGHGQGIIHRDIKPSNILLDAGGTPHVCDFGIAATRQELAAKRDHRATLAYASPEQLGDGPVDHRTDLWSLGVMMVEMVGGRRPFEAGDVVLLQRQILDAEPPTLAGIPEPLASVCRRCLAQQPEKRFARGNDVADALEKALRRSRPRRSRRLLAVLGAIITIVAVALAATWWPREETPTADRPITNLAVETPPVDPMPVPTRDDASRVLRGHKGVVRCVATTADGSLVASGGEDATLRLWPVDAEGVGGVALDHDGPVTALAFGPTGRTLLAGTSKGSVLLWGLPPQTRHERAVAEAGAVTRMASGPWPGLAPIPDRPWAMRVFPSREGAIRSVATSGDGRFVAWAGPNKVEVWELDGKEPLTVAQTPGESLLYFAFQSDGYLVAGFGFGTTRKVTTRSWQMVRVNDRWVASPRGTGKNLELFDDVRSVTMSPERDVVLMTQSAAVRSFVGEAKGPNLILAGSYESPQVVLTTTALLPDARRALSVGQDRVLRLWAVANAAQLAEYRGHTQPITRLAVGGNGSLVATSSEDGTVRLWKFPSHDRAVADWVASLGGEVKGFDVVSHADLYRVEEIGLDAKELTDDDMARFRGSSRLRTLKVRWCGVGDDGMRHLALVPSLEHLNLGGTRITDAGLRQLVRLPRLGRLYLYETPITDAGLDRLGELPLRDLSLGRTGVTDAGLPAIARCRSLYRLNLSSTPVTAKGIAHLRRLKELRSLHLNGVRLDAALVAVLKTLVGVEEFYVQGCDPKEIAALRLARPDCRVLTEW